MALETMHRYTESDVRDVAGARSYERGLGYLAAVGRLRVEGGQVTATVRGTELYRVVLDDHRGLRAACDCPYGEEGAFCKHCVAVALTVLRAPERLSVLRAEATARETALDAWLENLGRDELLALVRERLAADTDFHDALTLRATTASGDVTAAVSEIAALLDPTEFSQYGYIGYEDVSGYADQVTRAAGGITDLAAAGHGDAAVAAARAAIRRLSRVYESADDSDGSLAEAAAALGTAHLGACAAASPDPDETAQWLIDHVLADGGDVVDIDPAEYREVLGVHGLASLRSLAEEALRRNPSGWAEKSLMESLVRAEGDLDALIALHAADLAPDGSTHLAIAVELDAAGRADEALEWAARGLRHATAHSPRPDSRLVDLLAERYARAGRAPDALAVRRDHFRALRSLPTYRALRAIATEQGRWDSERPGALALLRADAEAGERGPYGGGPVLIDTLTDDGDLDAAWAAAADCPTVPTQWRRLADRSAQDRPADALGVYQREIRARARHTGDANYQEIADLLVKARACHEQIGTLETFTTDLAELRAAQKRKRNLMRVLDQRGL